MDLQQLIALQKASGGQNTITPENAGRIMGLAAQQEANRQLSMDAGKLAVQEAMNRQIASGERAAPNEQGEVDKYGRYVSPLQRQGRVITAPSGAKFVTDAQGNIVGTNAAIGIGAGSMGDRAAINRGEITAQERQLLNPAIQEAFQLEMQKRAPVQAMAAAPTAVPPITREQFIPSVRPIYDKSGFGARAPKMPETPTIPQKVSASSSQKAIPSLRQAFEQQALKSEKESVGTRLSDAERKAKEAMARFESGKGSASKEELQALAEEYAAAQADAELLNTPAQEQEAKLAELIKQIRQGKTEKMEPKGIFPRIGFGYESGKSYVSDAFQNAIMNPLREAFTGETAKPSNELYRYLLQQQLLRQAGF